MPGLPAAGAAVRPPAAVVGTAPAPAALGGCNFQSGRGEVCLPPGACCAEVLLLLLVAVVVALLPCAAGEEAGDCASSTRLLALQ